MNSKEVEKQSEEVTKEIAEMLDIKQSDTLFICLDSVLNLVQKYIAKSLNIVLPKLLEEYPPVKKFVQNIVGSIADFAMQTARGFFKLLYVAIRRPEFWLLVWNRCMKTWDENAENGITAQIVAFSKKFIAYVGELCVQSLNRALDAQGAGLNEEEKKEISEVAFNNERINLDQLKSIKN